MISMVKYAYAYMAKPLAVDAPLFCSDCSGTNNSSQWNMSCYVGSIYVKNVKKAQVLGPLVFSH